MASIKRTTKEEEEKCREAWNKHQRDSHPEDRMSYSEFRSGYGLPDDEDEDMEDPLRFDYDK